MHKHHVPCTAPVAETNLMGLSGNRFTALLPEALQVLVESDGEPSRSDGRREAKKQTLCFIEHHFQARAYFHHVQWMRTCWLRS